MGINVDKENKRRVSVTTNQYSATDDSDLDEKFKIYCKPKTVSHYSIYLSENVENNFAYSDLMHQFRSVGKENVVTLYLANYGGQCSTGFQLFNTIKECKARVDVVIDAPCYSMGAILALSGDSLRLQNGAFLMFHNYSSVEMGKGTEMHKAVTHYHDYFHRHLNRVCSPFLDKKELESLKNDNDIYIAYDDKDINKRIKRHFK